MKKFVYWSNKISWHQEKLFECKANSIAEADNLMFQATKFEPIKLSWISCQVFSI